ncbi:hypothetical protein SMACR_08532 [Sordaria macrospora]|uniref:WGS project CABT00000000 data, contig 2.59 n=2 Tax=Sordaria macrospora TaxID=5147 RepID=F7WA86_SORMK|nr:uncharacterized protein SMAC_08532 [Sordaria macrospora k-hell]KAA8627950.1 hypothetical protein SMACR_08532 [Sordaria macrospora]KAH7635794.1 hypothetical protein B0T09DRAFT_28264 [Sordaria sp. MPI-SDFR-AT-0083]WPJ64276.1 hypothetical protein SMAC4_08532 [Sordaria macrospora]CCC05280.1 unnamed protein product [Sordaria macrospora k-hell]
MSHKKVGFRDDSPSGASHYSDHQRSDSGVGSLSGSDCGVPNSDRTYTPRDYDDRRDAREILRLKNELTQADDKIKDLQAKIQQLERLQASHIQLKVDHKEVIVSEATLQAQLDAKQNENEVLSDQLADFKSKNTELLQKNKDLTSENTKLKDENKKLQELEDAKKPKDLKDPKDSSESVDSEKMKRPRRKSMSMPPPSESSDDRRPRRSSSRRAPHREHEKLDMDNEWERQLERERQMTLTHDRSVIDEEKERLRSRFRTRGEDSDAKSSNQSLPSLPPVTIRGQPRNNQRDSYVESSGRGAPRPQVPGPQVVSGRDAYDYSYNAPSYTTPQYASMREPRSAAPPAHHPAVYVPAPAGYVDNRYPADDDYRYHQQAIAGAKMPRRQ